MHLICSHPRPVSSFLTELIVKALGPQTNPLYEDKETYYMHSWHVVWMVDQTYTRTLHIVTNIIRTCYKLIYDQHQLYGQHTDHVAGLANCLQKQHRLSTQHRSAIYSSTSKLNRLQGYCFTIQGKYGLPVIQNQQSLKYSCYACVFSANTQLKANVKHRMKVPRVFTK